MLFVSNGAQILEKKLSLARQRMFLFTDDVTPPNALSTLAQVVKTVNKARSFSRLISSNKMKCTRAAGWADNKYYYTVVPNLQFTVAPQGSASETLTPFDMFARYYSIGVAAPVSVAPTGFIGSIIEVDGGDAFSYPPKSVMLLPCFDDTVAESAFTVKTASKTGTTVTLSASTSGSTSTGQWSSDWSTLLSTVRINQTNLAKADVASVPVNFDYAGAPTVTANVQTVTSTAAVSGTVNGPRIVYSSSSNTYGTRSFSGGGWFFSYNYYPNPYGSTTDMQEVNSLYGVCNHVDTPAYKIKFGMLPIVMGLQIPCVVQILSEGVDFVHTTPSSPVSIPDITMNAINAPQIDKVFSI